MTAVPPEPTAASTPMSPLLPQGDGSVAPGERDDPDARFGPLDPFVDSFDDEVDDELWSDPRPRLPASGPVGDMRIGPAASTRQPPAEIRGSRHVPRRRTHAMMPFGTTVGELLRALLFPGVTTLTRSRLFGAVLVLLGVVGPLVVAAVFFLQHSNPVDLVVDDRFIIAVLATAVGFVLARLVAIIEVSLFRRRHQRVLWPTVGAFVLLTAMAVPIGFSASRIRAGSQDILAVFPDARSSIPVFLPSLSAAGANPDIHTTLVLGRDPGPGGTVASTESMVLVTVHGPSNRVGLVTIAADLVGLRFPPGSTLALTFPDGYPDRAASLHPQVEADPGLVLEFQLDDLPAADLAVAAAVGTSLDVRIDDVVLVDTTSFVELVDVAGGVSIPLEGSVPLPRELVGVSAELPERVGPGRVEMDGSLATAYIRSGPADPADPDGARVVREREVLEAIVSQTSSVEVLADFSQVGEVLGASVRTTSSRGSLSAVGRALSEPDDVIASVVLGDPVIDAAAPDYAAAQQLVDDVERLVATGPSPDNDS